MISRYSWQYNGVAKWDEIVSWCRYTFPDYDRDDFRWYSTIETIHFVEKDDYILFLLRWA